MVERLLPIVLTSSAAAAHLQLLDSRKLPTPPLLNSVTCRKSHLAQDPSLQVPTGRVDINVFKQLMVGLHMFMITIHRTASRSVCFQKFAPP